MKFPKAPLAASTSRVQKRRLLLHQHDAMVRKVQQQGKFPEQVASDHPLSAQCFQRPLQRRRQHTEAAADAKTRELDLALVDVGLELAE